MANLPLKLRIFDYMAKQDAPVSVQDVIDGISAEYPGERQMRYPRVDDYMQQLLGVNMIRESQVDYDENGDLRVRYEVSDFGRSRIKYIPRNADNV